MTDPNPSPVSKTSPLPLTLLLTKLDRGVASVRTWGGAFEWCARPVLQGFKHRSESVSLSHQQTPVTCGLLCARGPYAPMNELDAPADLVFIQNGMLQPWLDDKGLGDNTQVMHGKKSASIAIRQRLNVAKRHGGPLLGVDVPAGSVLQLDL